MSQTPRDPDANANDPQRRRSLFFLQNKVSAVIMGWGMSMQTKSRYPWRVVSHVSQLNKELSFS